MCYEERARLLGLPLHIEVTVPAGAQDAPYTRIDTVIYVSGRTSMHLDTGRVIAGTVGDDLSIEQGQEAARLAMSNGTLSPHQAAGSLNNVRRILRDTGYVKATPDFAQQPDVINGASSLLFELFGERGRHARTAIGVASSPRGAAVEVELIAEVE